MLDLIEFGFAIDHNGTTGGNHQVKNHKGATDFKSDIEKYLDKETKLRATIGPFLTSPFEEYNLSPLNSVPK